MKTFWRLLAIGALALAPVRASAELVIVVSASNPIQALRAEQIADIFLGQVGRFPDGSAAVALDQVLGSSLRNEFYTRVVAKSPPLLKAHWSRMIFTGRGQPPTELPNSAAVRKMVAGNPAYIGYIDKATLDHSVKAVLVLP